MDMFMNGIRRVVCLSVIIITSLSGARAEGEHNGLLYPALVQKFYQITHQQPFWFNSPAAAAIVRAHFLKQLDSAVYLGLDKDKYHYAAIASETAVVDSAGINSLDKIYTDAAIAFCKDVYQGTGINKWLRNDEISLKYEAADDNYIMSRLVAVKLIPDVDVLLYSLEPHTAGYNALKAELAHQLETHNTQNVQQLNTALNFMRWITHFHFDKYIVVNIPSGTLRYCEKDSTVLQMNVITGKLNSQTPVFSTWCNQVILYPYWYVPSDIAVKEILPKVKKDPSKIDKLNMQLIDASGNVVDYNTVNWDSVTAGNFHYRFRQSTGCSNSLGVIKFNLTDPFDVYMHDTNLKEAFEKKQHNISHGCIRLENPIELATLLLGDRMDESLVRSCAEGQEPIVNRLPKPIPVFIVYLLAYPDENNTVTYPKDVYHFMK